MKGKSIFQLNTFLWLALRLKCFFPYCSYLLKFSVFSYRFVKWSFLCLEDTNPLSYVAFIFFVINLSFIFFMSDKDLFCLYFFKILFFWIKNSRLTAFSPSIFKDVSLSRFNCFWQEIFHLYFCSFTQKYIVFLCLPSNILFINCFE